MTVMSATLRLALSGAPAAATALSGLIGRDARARKAPTSMTCKATVGDIAAPQFIWCKRRSGIHKCTVRAGQQGCHRTQPTESGRKPSRLLQFRKASHRGGLQLVQVKHQDLVLASAQPARRAIETPLGTEVPVASQVVPVHPDQPFLVFRKIQESVGGFGQVERSAEEDPRPFIHLPWGNRWTYSSLSGSEYTCQFISVMPFSVTRSVIPFRSIMACPKLIRPIPSTRIVSTGLGLSVLGRAMVSTPSRRSSLPM